MGRPSHQAGCNLVLVHEGMNLTQPSKTSKVADSADSLNPVVQFLLAFFKKILNMQSSLDSGLVQSQFNSTLDLTVFGSNPRSICGHRTYNQFYVVRVQSKHSDIGQLASFPN